MRQRTPTQAAEVVAEEAEFFASLGYGQAWIADKLGVTADELAVAKGQAEAALETADPGPLSPTLAPVWDREAIALQAVADVQQMAKDVRELDPREVWGCLTLLYEQDRNRLIAAYVAALAALPRDKSMAELLAWTRQYDRTETAA
jgi:hypothetical protein